MNRSTYHTKIILFILLAIALGGINFFNRVKADSSSATRGKLRADTQKAVDLQKLQSDYDRYADEIDKVSALLPDNQSFPLLVDFFEQGAKSRNLDLKLDFGEKETDKTAGVPAAVAALVSQAQNQAKPVQNQGSAAPGLVDPNTVIFNAETQGELQNLLSYYELLEKSPYIIHITKLTLDAPDGLGAKATLSYEVKVYVDPSLNQQK